MMVSRFAMEIATAVFTLLVGIVVSISSIEFGITWGKSGPMAGVVPFYLGVFIALGSIGTLVQVIRARKPEVGEGFISKQKFKDLSMFAIGVFVFALLAVTLGMYIATALYLSFITWWKASMRPVSAIALGLGVSIFFWVAFEIAFQLPLPKGPILEFFGFY